MCCLYDECVENVGESVFIFVASRYTFYALLGVNMISV